MTPEQVAAYTAERRSDMGDLLRSLVELESPTSEPERVDAVGELLAARLAAVGAVAEHHAAEDRGHHVVGRIRGSSHGAPVLLIGHMDTVWPLGTTSRRPFTVRGDRAEGPGVLDMKAGLVIILHVLEGLAELGSDRHPPVTVLFNSDEEMQSRTSRALIEREALASRAALVFEGSHAVERFTTERKASGRFTLTAHGKAAHAGNALDEGSNAIEELAHHVLAIQALTDRDAGTTASVGVIEGGARPNVVPDTARATASVRATSLSEMRRIEERIRGVEAIVPGCTIEVDGGFHRGLFTASPALFDHLVAAARPLGIDPERSGSGGGSDANITAAVGTPTLDGLGAVGGGAHAVDEHVDLASLPMRTAIAIQLLRRL